MSALYGLPSEVRWCVRCVMSNQRPSSAVEHEHKIDTKKATLHIDADGVCDACRFAEQKKGIDWERRELELQALLERYRGVGVYDCIVPGSGGKDSYYAAHVLKHKYGMRPLLITWAPHLPTDWGFQNLLRWQEIADSYVFTPSRRVHRFLTRMALERLFHPFQPFILGQKSFAPKVAAMLKIPLVFYGESEAEYGNPIADTLAPVRAMSYWTTDKKDIYLGGASIPEIESYGYTQSDLDPYIPTTLGALVASRVEVHYLGYYLKWHPQSAYYYAAEHGGFEAAPERTPGTYSKYNSIDDKIDDLHYWTTWIKFGIGRATYDAAQEVRSGDITREEAVALVKRFDGEYPERFEREVFEYLSVPGFEPMTREYLKQLANKFRSPHLWECIGPYGTWQLKNTVWDCAPA